MSEELGAHIRCGRRDAAPYAILPGDPGRINHIARHLNDVREIAYNREFRSIRGTYQGIEVMAVSTGIGGASTVIAVEELHKIGVKAMIRVGSCGALQSDIRLGELILVSGAVRDDGASKTYVEGIYPAIPDTGLLFCAREVAKERGYRHRIGPARSHDSFYTDRENEIDHYWSGRGVLGSDMETAALFVVGALRGVMTASILNTVVTYEGDLEEGINDYVGGGQEAALGEEREILVALDALKKFDKGVF